jgi:hypothetical protein
MADFCIPKPIVEKMKEAIRNGEISLENLNNLPSADRNVLFAKYTTPELANALNASFEKAIVSKQKNALIEWAKSVTTESKAKPDIYKKTLDRINKLDEMGALDPDSSQGFLSDLVAERLGIKVTADEVAGITKRAQKLEELSSKIADNPMADDAYWIARKEMDDYVNSLNPSHQLKVATSTIGRGTMLFSIKSPLTNILSNTVMGGITALERRVVNKSYRGLNGEFAVNFVKRVNSIYQKSGFDISRMDAEWQGQRRLGEEVTSAQGPGTVRAIGRWYEDVVFKQLMGAPDVAASSIAFADSADLMSSKIAKLEGLTDEAAKTRALEIFQDAIRIEPQTVQGVVVRAQSIADARYSTFTDKSKFSQLAMTIRKGLNQINDDIRLGDQLMPFVKTPAQVTAASMDNAGAGGIRALFSLPDALKALKAGDTAPMREVAQLSVRSGIGLTLATILAYTINPEDFVGDYDLLTPKEKQIAAMENAPYNSIRIGGKWVSLDYLGPLSAPLIGILYARKYGADPGSAMWAYARGAGTQLFRMPGFTEVKDLIGGIQSAATSDKPGEIAMGITDELVGFISSRVIPGIVSDIAKGFDSTERVTGKDVISKTATKIPGWRQTLPEKISQVTGETIPTEGALSTLLFGSRVKTARDNAVIDEINRLTDTDNAPAIMDIERASPKVKTLKQSLSGMDYQEAIQFYGRTYGSKADSLINTPDYNAMSDEEKMKALNSVRSDALDEMLMQYNPNLTAKEKIKKDLQPYLNLEDNVWSEQPYQLRMVYKQIQEFEKSGDTARAKALLQKFPQILNIRAQIATAKKQLRMTNPKVRAAYEATYGRESIWK